MDAVDCSICTWVFANGDNDGAANTHGSDTLWVENLMVERSRPTLRMSHMRMATGHNVIWSTTFRAGVSCMFSFQLVISFHKPIQAAALQLSESLVESCLADYGKVVMRHFSRSAANLLSCDRPCTCVQPVANVTHTSAHRWYHMVPMHMHKLLPVNPCGPADPKRLLLASVCFCSKARCVSQEPIPKAVLLCGLPS